MKTLDTTTMATAATPEAAAESVPVADRGDAVEVDGDVSLSIDELRSRALTFARMKYLLDGDSALGDEQYVWHPMNT